MAEENSEWGAPKIHGELLKLGFEVSERTIARYLRRMRPRRLAERSHFRKPERAIEQDRLPGAFGQ